MGVLRDVAVSLCHARLSRPLRCFAEPTRAWEIGFEPSGGIALYKTGDAASLGCADVPPSSKSGSALDAVICPCK